MIQIKTQVEPKDPKDLAIVGLSTALAGSIVINLTKKPELTLATLKTVSNGAVVLAGIAAIKDLCIHAL